MSEERPASGATPSALDIAGGLLGLIVFLAGIGLLVSVFLRASQLYSEIAPAIDAARVGTTAAAPAPTSPPALTHSAGPVVADPGGKPLTKVGTEFGLKFLWLLVQGVLAALVAGMGAKLAGAHRGKRT